MTANSGLKRKKSNLNFNIRGIAALLLIVGDFIPTAFDDLLAGRNQLIAAQLNSIIGAVPLLPFMWNIPTLNKISLKMEEAVSFINYFRSSLDKEIQEPGFGENISKDFFCDFIQFTPSILRELSIYIDDKRIGLFYNRLNDLKYLCVFNENLNLFWFSMRALSGTLFRLNSPGGLENAKKLHCYYLEKYGDRKVLRDENWFENRRWIFIDSLEKVTTEEELSTLIENNRIVLKCFLENYQFHLGRFIEEVRTTLSIR